MLNADTVTKIETVHGGWFIYRKAQVNVFQDSSLSWSLCMCPASFEVISKMGVGLLDKNLGLSK